MNIVKVNRRTAMSCINLRDFGCDGMPVDPSNVHIILYRAGLGVLQCEEYFADLGCGQLIGPKKRFVRVRGPKIKYCAFKSDEDGDVCFLWDDKFLKAEPGRWDGEVYVCDELVATVLFQLGDRYVITAGKDVPGDPCAPQCC